MKKLYLYAAVFAAASVTFLPALAQETHPTIRHAISALEQSEAELKNGEHGFGGHRSKAIEHIDAALKELHQALEYADTHPDEVKPGAEAPK